MEPTFNDAVQFTLVQEGVLSNNPNDKGGLTKYGVTQKTWDEYRLGNTKVPKSVADITIDQAIDVYYHIFWIEPGIDALPAELRGPTFDFAVNSGEGEAIKTLQKCAGLVPDGKLGPVSLKKFDAMNVQGLKKLRNDYVTARGVYLMGLAQADKRDIAFIKGWFTRLVKLYDTGN